ncbi:bridging integrator 3 [Anabrus simplex]|uniref:bridging integrator 3 n=1 Tax=Anabrus simplex TaxID=316456 RepID=UPI0035A389BE
MTWNPLKKNHLTTKLTFASPVIDRNVDQQLEVIYHRLQYLEETTRKLQKNMKKYLDHLSNACKAEQKITTDLSSSQLCYQNEEFRKIVENYHTIAAKGNENVKEVSLVCQQAFQDPLKKYGSFFSGIDMVFHRREQLVQEWRNISGKVRKMEERERTASNLVKLDRERKALEVVSQELISYHNSLISELNQFLSKRVDYFDPIFLILVRSLVDYYGDMTRLFTHLITLPSPPQDASPSSACIPEEEYQQKIQAKLAKIRALSIVKPSKSK